jgi:hypothetical protein
MSKERIMPKEQYASELQELTEELGRYLVSAAPRPVCRVVVTNSCPPEWNVAIVAAATQFLYQDVNGDPEGNPTKDIKSPIYVTSGGSVIMESVDPNRCVRTAATVIYVQIPEQPPEAIEAIEDVGTGYCAELIPYTIGPAQALSFESFKSGHKRAMLELIRVPKEVPHLQTPLLQRAGPLPGTFQLSRTSHISRALSLLQTLQPTQKLQQSLQNPGALPVPNFRQASWPNVVQTPESLQALMGFPYYRTAVNILCPPQAAAAPAVTYTSTSANFEIRNLANRDLKYLFYLNHQNNLGMFYENYYTQYLSPGGTASDTLQILGAFSYPPGFHGVASYSVVAFIYYEGMDPVYSEDTASCSFPVSS